eukprot:6177983-Heterocapsa_arctica.AAC.1
MPPVARPPEQVPGRMGEGCWWAKGYRGRPSLSPSDAKQHFEPDNYNGSRKNRVFGRTRLSGRALDIAIGCATTFLAKTRQRITSKCKRITK